MSFGGGSAPSPPPAQPVTPVPQNDDPKSLEAQRKAAVTAKDREGYSAHLLSDGKSDTAMGSPDPLSGSKPKTANMME